MGEPVIVWPGPEGTFCEEQICYEYGMETGWLYYLCGSGSENGYEWVECCPY